MFNYVFVYSLIRTHNRWQFLETLTLELRLTLILTSQNQRREVKLHYINKKKQLHQSRIRFTSGIEELILLIIRFLQRRLIWIFIKQRHNRILPLARKWWKVEQKSITLDAVTKTEPKPKTLVVNIMYKSFFSGTVSMWTVQ